VSLEIRTIQSNNEIHECANLMSNSKPWVTLGRTYKESILLLQDTSREVYIALIEGETVGFIIIQMQGAFRGYIPTLAIKPEFRNQEIGSSLLKFAEKRIFRETPNVFICVSSFNENAKRLYIRLGYEVVGKLRNYIISGHSEILLRKSISPLSEFQSSL